MDMESLVESIGKFLGRIFGTQNERAVKRYWKIVREQINPLEAKMLALPDSAFPGMTRDFRARLAKDEASPSMRAATFTPLHCET